MVWLASMYEQGTGVEQDHDKAEELCAEAAALLLEWEADDDLTTEDKFTLGQLYLTGYGVDQDEAKAMELLNEAAAMGSEAAAAALEELAADTAGD